MSTRVRVGIINTNDTWPNYTSAQFNFWVLCSCVLTSMKSIDVPTHVLWMLSKFQGQDSVLVTMVSSAETVKCETILISIIHVILFTIGITLKPPKCPSTSEWTTKTLYRCEWWFSNQNIRKSYHMQQHRRTWQVLYNPLTKDKNCISPLTSHI